MKKDFSITTMSLREFEKMIDYKLSEGFEKKYKEFEMKLDKELEEKLEKRLKEFEKAIGVQIDDKSRRMYLFLDYRIEPIEAAVKDYYHFKDQVLKNLDWLVAAYKKFEEEYLVVTEKYTTVQDDVDLLEKRTRTLEDNEKDRKAN